MLKNDLKTAARSLLRNKQFTLLNIIGLAIGLAACLLMAGYVIHEASFENMHGDADRIYRVNSLIPMGEREINNATVTTPLGPAVADSLPEVETSVRIRREKGLSVRVANRDFRVEQAFLAESGIFEVFSLPLLRGDPRSVLDMPFTVVLDETLSRRLFGAQDPVGQTLEIRLDKYYPFQVTGIMMDIPTNTVLQRPLMMSFASFLSVLGEAATKWEGWGMITTFVRLKPEADLKAVGTKITNLASTHLGEAGKGLAFYLQPLKKIYLDSRARGMSNDLDNTGSLTRIYLFSAIALLILVVAAVNFINLATAKVARRMKEVGVRKTCGAARSTLIQQFLTESLLLTALAMILGLILFGFFKPVLDQYLGKELSLGLLTTPWMFPVVAAFVVVVGILAGSYPAFFLSRFPAVVVFRSGLAPGSLRSGLRRVLVVFQFVVAVALTAGTLLVIKQVRFAEHKDLGFDRQNLVVFRNRDRDQSARTAVLKNEILSRTDTVAATLMTSLPSHQNRNIMTLRPEGKMEDEEIMAQVLDVDADFVPTLGLQIIRGRNFEEGRAADADAVLVNETAAEVFGFDDPVGGRLFNLDRVFRIIGVVKDWHTNSIHSRIYPTVIFPADENSSTVVVRLKPGGQPATLARIQEIWNRVLPGQTYEYAYVDDVLLEAYNKERRLAGLLISFCLLTVFVACLGIFGLASYTTEQRTKEIGIRKILGANVTGVIALLVRSFTVWVLFAWAVACPLAYFIVKKWLQAFTYRTPLGPWPFLLAGGLALAIALVSIAYQTIKAALTNPADVLRYE